MAERARVQVQRAHSRERIGTWAVIAVLTVALIIVYVSNRNLVNCVNDYFELSQATQRARSEALEKNDQAVEDMVKGVLLPTATPAERAGSLRGFLETREQVKKERKENPIQAPPDHC